MTVSLLFDTQYYRAQQLINEGIRDGKDVSCRPGSALEPFFRSHSQQQNLWGQPC